LEKGTFTTIDIPGDSGPQPTQLVGINNRGQMVGLLIDADGLIRGFLRGKKGAITLPDHPEATPPNGGGTGPLGINDRGQVVGIVR
jgi:hypothetical protein